MGGAKISHPAGSIKDLNLNNNKGVYHETSVYASASIISVMRF